jgi:hypothetical protein
MAFVLPKKVFGESIVLSFVDKTERDVKSLVSYDVFLKQTLQEKTKALLLEKFSEYLNSIETEMQKHYNVVTFDAFEEATCLTTKEADKKKTTYSLYDNLSESSSEDDDRHFKRSKKSKKSN